MQDQQPGPERDVQTQEIVIDFRREKQKSHYAPLKIYRALVEKVSSYRYLGDHTSEDLIWTIYITSVVKMAMQRLSHLRLLRKLKGCRKPSSLPLPSLSSLEA